MRGMIVIGVIGVSGCLSACSNTQLAKLRCGVLEPINAVAPAIAAPESKAQGDSGDMDERVEAAIVSPAAPMQTGVADAAQDQRP